VRHSNSSRPTRSRTSSQRPSTASGRRARVAARPRSTRRRRRV